MTRRAWLFTAAFYVLVAVVATWPLVMDPARSIRRTNDDLYHFIWVQDWTQRALVDPNVDMLEVPTQNYPTGWYAAMAEWPILAMLIGAPAGWVGGAVLGVNVSILLSHVVTGLAVFIWVRRRSDCIPAGLVAGAAFVISPFRSVHLDHYATHHTEWMPLYLLAVEDLLRAQGGRRKWLAAVASGGLLGLIALTKQYYLLITLVLTVPYVLTILWQERRGALRTPGLVGRLALAAIVALPILALAEYPLFTAAKRGVIRDRSLEYARTFSASPTDFFMPPLAHPLWGAWFGQFHRPDPLSQERDLYLGLVTITLAGYAVAIRKRVAWGRTVPPLVVLGLAGFVLALGTDLHWMSEPVRVDTSALPGSLLTRFDGYLPLPQRALRRWLPFYASMRAWPRYGVYVTLATMLLAGLGLAHGLSRVTSPNKRLALAACVLALVGLDFGRTPLPLTPVRARAVDYWLAEQPDVGALVDLPIQFSNDARNVYYTTVHGKRYLGCYGGSFNSPQFRELNQELATPFTRQGMCTMAARGVYYVVVDTSRYDDWVQLEETLPALGLAPLFSAEGYQVLGLAAPPGGRCAEAR